MAYGAKRVLCDAPTDIAYGAMQCPLLTSRMVLSGSRVLDTSAVCPPISIRACSAMCGTDRAYGASRCAVLTLRLCLCSYDYNPTIMIHGDAPTPRLLRICSYVYAPVIMLL
eukprot:3940681-Rhodomonas_salina.2